MRSADDFLRGRSCGGAEPRALSPGPQPELSARNPTQESYRKHRNCRDRKAWLGCRESKPRGTQGYGKRTEMHALRNCRYAAIGGSSEPPRTAEAPVTAGIKAPHGPQKQQKQNSRNHKSRRNPRPQRPPVPPAETQKTLRPPHVCGSRRVRHRMPRPERSGKASVLLRLRCGAGIPARRAAPLPTSRRAVRPAPRPSRPPGRRNRADPYRRGSGDRRSRSPSGSPADRPCPGWRPR